MKNTQGSSTHIKLLQYLLITSSCIACHESGDPADELNHSLGGAMARWPEMDPEITESPEDRLDNPWLSFDGSGGSLDDAADPTVLDGSSSEEDDSSQKADSNMQGGDSVESETSPEAQPLSPETKAESPSESESSNAQEQEKLDSQAPASSAESADNNTSPTEEVPTDVPLPIPIPVLRFFEYYEGPGSEKALGIENLASTSASDCAVEIFSNGGTEAWRSLAISDIPAYPGRALLCTNEVNRSDCTDPMSSSTFNGNDALVLSCSGTVIDSFGRVGEDPGTAWTSEEKEGLTTKDARLVRCTTAADTSPSDSFNLDTDWSPWNEGESEELARSLCGVIDAAMGGASSEP